ncbi:hypothetical protein M0Q50_05845 [bacterium]|jgi:hypothetical protein|nr:hypothetical protein [bacterium]
MDIFGFKARKAKHEEEIKLKEENELKEFNSLKADYQLLEQRAEKIAINYNIKSKNETSNSNSICPKCGSTDIIDKINKINGEFNGSIDGEYSNSSIFSGYGYIKGSSHGEIDTKSINKCKNCEHEWDKLTSSYKYSSDILYDYYDKLIFALKAYNYAINPDFNLKDLNEKFSSIEEKRKSLIYNLKYNIYKNEISEFFKDISIEHIYDIGVYKIYNSTIDSYITEYKNKTFIEYWNEEFLQNYYNLKHK